jgi:hypothetical protein
MNKDIITHFQQIQALIAEGKAKALQAATAYSLLTYWNIGAYLNERLTEKTYGKKIVSQLADWLLLQEPTLKGFDRRSLYRMREFFETWQVADWSLVAPNTTSNKIFIGENLGLAEQKIVGSLNPQLPPFPNIELGKQSRTKKR